MSGPESLVERLREVISAFDADVSDHLANESERADLWYEVDIPVSLVREAAAELSALRERCEPAERENAKLLAAIEAQSPIVASYIAEHSGEGKPISVLGDWLRLVAKERHRAEAAIAARDEAVAALEEGAERYAIFRKILVDTMDTSPPTEGAQEFINRLTEAMEAAADKLDASPAPPSGDAL